MREGKKLLGMKHKIREERKREERLGLVVIVAILITIIFVSGFFVNSMLNQPSTSPTSQTSSTSEPSEPKAAIVDHLSLTYPNLTFIETATTTLKQTGYTVDYYSGEKVTVEFYRNLPKHGYSLIILRVHSSASELRGTEQFEAPVVLFTSEIYSSSKYVYEQLTDGVTRVSFNAIQPSSPENPDYFAVTPNFVASSMKGRFQNTTVIMMGCEGLDNVLMAKAFVEKGAKVYISWSKPVLASHTDQATTHLLQHLISQKQPLQQAIDSTMKDVGPDPIYKSRLLYYPFEAEDYIIQQ